MYDVHVTSKKMLFEKIQCNNEDILVSIFFKNGRIVKRTHFLIENNA